MSSYLFTRSRSNLKLQPRNRRVLPVCCRNLAESATNVTATSTPPQDESTRSNEAWLFVDKIFPIRIGKWDVRYLLGQLRQKELLSKLQDVLTPTKTHGFDILSLVPHQKDGGVFVKFKYFEAGDPQQALLDIEKDLRDGVRQRGGIPSWIQMSLGNVWLVKGKPWREDLNRFASPFVKVSFEGPDVQEESLYDLLRPYGKIEYMTPPSPVPAGSLRYSIVRFERYNSAIVARNAVHGYRFAKGGSQETKIHTMFEAPIKAHAIRDWISGHPRIALPILFFALGTLTYTIFDPIREFMVESKLLNYFNVKEYRIYKWLRANAIERLPFSLVRKGGANKAENLWKERKDAEDSVRSYLSDLPSTIAFVHGPQGSGKERMLEDILQDSNRNYVIIDCAELHKATTDAALIDALAGQTGYWPVFSFLNSINNMIDVASVGLIGQKTGLSSTLPEQLSQLLDVVSKALSSVRNSQSKTAEQQKVKAKRRDASKAANLAALANPGGKAAILEQPETQKKIAPIKDSEGNMPPENLKPEDFESEGRSAPSIVHMDESAAVASIPIVIIRNYASKRGSTKEELLNALATWATSLAENQVAHVIVVSDNRENVKRLAKSLPSKPIQTVELFDADQRTALAFVKQKLEDAGSNVNFSGLETVAIERLGGRASDLDSLIHKVRSGLKVEDAVEDIITRGVSELRKNAFGDDVDDAKNLAWTREQAWTVLKTLSKQDEIPYHSFVLDYPFKGDDSSLRGMEQAELISISTSNGRPSKIRPGRPIYRHVFERLTNDAVFSANQDIYYNDKLLAIADSTIRVCESELMNLNQIESVETFGWFGGKHASSERISYLLSKMLNAQLQIKQLEQQNADLKKILARD